MASANPLREALTTGRFCYMVEMVASASMAEAKLWEIASGIAQIPEVVAAGITSYAGGGRVTIRSGSPPAHTSRV